MQAEMDATTANDAPGEDAASSDAGTLPPEGSSPEAATLMGQGASCTKDTECGTAYCVDGVCCDSACTGSCQQCNLGALKGTCSPVLAGQVAPAPHAACAQSDAGTCATDGKCDGKGACELWADGTTCGGGSCNAGTNEAVQGSACDGKGTCVASAAVMCAPFKCTADGTACTNTCSTSNDCVGQPCVNNSCGTVVNGSKCTAAAQCKSGNCVDGYCCDMACGGSCQACDLSGSQGTCTTIPSGPPHGSRAACAGSGVCQGVCNGFECLVFVPEHHVRIAVLLRRNGARRDDLQRRRRLHRADVDPVPGGVRLQRIGRVLRELLQRWAVRQLALLQRPERSVPDDRAARPRVRHGGAVRDRQLRQQRLLQHGCLHGHRSVPPDRHVQRGHWRVLLRSRDERDDVQRRQPVYAD